MRLRRQREGSGRFLTTILFVDIVGSTELASAIGDAAWQILLGRYYAAVRGRLRRFGGRQIDTAGDGLFAAFDAPAEAITCALAIRDAATELGFATRAGLHMGEVQTIEGKVGGIAVHIGARIAGIAGPAEVLVSGTVKDLVEGSGLRFEERAEEALKGVPGRWRLFVALSPDVIGASATVSAAVSGGRPAVPRREAVGGALSRLIPHSAWARGLVVAIVAVVLVATAGNVLLTKEKVAPSPPAVHSPSAIPSVAVDANSLGRLDPGTGMVVSDVPVGAQPSGIAVAADGSIWVTNTTAGTVSRLDPTGTRVIQTIEGVGTSPTGIAVGSNAIWVADSGSQQIARIDPVTNTLVKEYPVGNAPSGMAADATGQLWIADRLDGTLVRLDPATGLVTPFTIGLTPIDVAFGAGSVWVSDYDKGTVVRVDPGDGAVLARVSVGNGASALAATDQAVWVANRLDGTMSHIDPITNSVVAAPSVGGEPSGVAIGPDAVWVAVASTSELVKIDPLSNAVVGQFPLGASPQAVAMAGAQPLFTAWTTPGNHTGGTLRIVGAGPTYVPTSPDPSWNIPYYAGVLSLTNDGLLNYRQVGGPGGLELAPDLATSIPTASPDGTTYVFQLRRGISFSNGVLLQPSDVLWSVERTIVASKTLYGNGNTFGLLLDQKALADCTAVHCDLSKEVVVDNATGSVTFHLTAPDPLFLYSLVGAYVVPAGTPFKESAIPLPATGPYLFTRFDANEMVLKRNPSFHVWSQDAQPQGYPDEIDWLKVPDEAAALAAVESGQADWLADNLTIGQVDQLKTDRPDQLNIAPSTKTWFEVMNPTMEPFKSIDVRKAVNDVVDRQAVAEAFGGGLVTCQVVPPTFAGYEPYCPYTINPDPSQTWRGPTDLTQAINVIRKAGMYGKPVTIWTSTDQPLKNVQLYFVGLLKSLRFKVTSKYLDDAQIFGGDPASPLTAPAGGGHPNTAQMAGFYNESTIPTAAQIFPGSFTCAGFAGGAYDSARYPEQFCDKTIDDLVQKATVDDQSSDPTLRAAANVLWAQIDRDVVDQAPAVFAFNAWDTNFFSKRVGNYQHQPMLDILLDQLWVQ